MTDFVAIDFETANAKCSICSLGLVIVENGIITDRIYSLIKPTPNYYSFWATDIHGISYVDTIKAPAFLIFGQISWIKLKVCLLWHTTVLLIQLV